MSIVIVLEGGWFCHVHFLQMGTYCNSAYVDPCSDVSYVEACLLLLFPLGLTSCPSASPRLHPFCSITSTKLFPNLALPDPSCSLPGKLLGQMLHLSIECVSLFTSLYILTCKKQDNKGVRANHPHMQQSIFLNTEF